MSKREHDVEPPARALAAGADVQRPGSCEQLDRREPSIFLFSEFRCGPIDGARAVELFAATGSLHIGAGRQRTGRPWLTQLVGLTRAQGLWRIRRRRISISRLSDRRRVGAAAW